MGNLEDIFDDNEFLEPNQIVNEELTDQVDDSDFFNDESNQNLNIDPIVEELLKIKGISDGKVKIINEDNKQEEVLFSNLSKEEQITILNDETYSDNYGLDDSEIEFINEIRKNKVSINQYLDNYKNNIINSIPKEEQEQNYDIDNYDDNELFLLDLKNKYDLTDEELLKELEKELEDDTLFKKKVDILRKEYKKLEDEYTQIQQLEQEEKQKEEYQNFSQNMVNIAVATPEFYGIELEDNEKEEVLSFLLDVDEQGVSKFSQTINDPKKLYEAAWFLRYGKESFDALKNAYESEINKLKRDGTRVVRKVNNNTKKNIHELF